MRDLRGSAPEWNSRLIGTFLQEVSSEGDPIQAESALPLIEGRQGGIEVCEAAGNRAVASRIVETSPN
jgi:hypothetical protein